MRVIHVVTAYPRHAGDPITPWLVELLRRQRRSGLDVSVLAPAYRGGPETPAATADVPVERFRYAPAPLETLTHDETVPDRLRRAPLRSLLVPPYLLGGMLAAGRAGAREKPDVVHVHWPMPHALLGATLRRASGGRSALVCSYYSVEIHWVRSHLRPVLPFLRWTVRTADEATAISTSTAAAVRELVDRPVAVIPYGAAMADDGSPPTRLALTAPAGEDRPVRVLFVGRLVERKGVEVLVRAVVMGFRRPVELRIVGAGEWEPRIRSAVRDAGLREVPDGASGAAEAASDEASASEEDRNAVAPVSVRFVGRLSDEELRREYEMADIFVLPAVRDAKGDTEGLGVVLLEALRFERPVIGSDIGGIPDIIEHGVTGLLCPSGDEAALAAAIRRLIDEPETARALARRGRERASAGFGWEGVVAATTAAYERAIRARSARR